ncbi:MAG: type II toxin-antitoxin system RelE/ParE family toxin [Chitinophagales bacterium]
MKPKLVFGVEFEADLKESYLFYEQQRAGLGDDFILAVEAALAEIYRNPMLFAQVYKNMRKVNLKRFPFGVFYVVQNNETIILAVLHLVRAPASWKKRKP